MNRILFSVIIGLLMIVFLLKVIKKRVVFRKKLAYYGEMAEQFLKEMDQISGKYITFFEKENLRKKYEEAYEFIKLNKKRIPNKKYIRFNLDEYENFDKYVDEMNEVYCVDKINKYHQLFFSENGYELDEQQKRAIVIDETYHLVVAGAGTGKTSTIIGKIKYLVHALNVDPSEIIVLAFNRNAATELTERLTSTGISMVAQTFHRLGLAIISNEHNQRPNVVDDNVLIRMIKSLLKGHLSENAVYAREFLKYWGLYSFPFSSIKNNNDLRLIHEQFSNMNFETLKSKFTRYRQAHKMSLKGETLRSIEETVIANFLFLHGIEYEYEKRYPFLDNNSVIAYHPDFYLPEYDIYLEHFGINEKGRVPWLKTEDEKKYLDGIKWKRGLHRINNTKLIETYSYWHINGNFVDKLDELLKSKGIKYKSIDEVEVFSSLIHDETYDYFLSNTINTIYRFIVLFKENSNVSINALRHEDSKLSRNGNARALTFYNVIEPIYNAYQKYLLDNNAIDFSDMIVESTRIVQSTGYSTPIRYILVDEFQDISFARMKLLQMIQQKTGAKLFCVGDDWQSIYRFTGSDIGCMINFSRIFTGSKISKIEKTYRYSQELISISESFVLKNPNQIVKGMISDKHEINPVRIIYYFKEKVKALNRAIDSIIEDYGTDKEIMLLLRNNSDISFLKDAEGWIVRKNGAGEIVSIKSKLYPNTKIQFSTVHRSKGAESDNIIIVNTDNAPNGFPNKILDEPLLERFLTCADNYLFSEERRLFYVAMTRTKHRVYILSMKGERESTFVREIAEVRNVQKEEIKEDNRPNANVSKNSCNRWNNGVIEQLKFDEEILGEKTLTEETAQRTSKKRVLQEKVEYHQLAWSFDEKEDKREYIVCMVSFSGSSRLYAYLTEDLSIKEGSKVIVNVSDDNVSKTVEVKKVLSCTRENAPFPIEKMKHVLGKIS